MEEVLQEKQLKRNNKAEGPDQIPIEMSKLTEENQIEILVDLCNIKYSTIIMLRDCLISIFIALAKNQTNRISRYTRNKNIKDTREALFFINVLIQICIDVRSASVRLVIGLQQNP